MGKPNLGHLDHRNGDERSDSTAVSGADEFDLPRRDRRSRIRGLGVVGASLAGTSSGPQAEVTDSIGGQGGGCVGLPTPHPTLHREDVRQGAGPARLTN
jgi:hypothetical protein